MDATLAFVSLLACVCLLVGMRRVQRMQRVGDLPT